MGQKLNPNFVPSPGIESFIKHFEAAMSGESGPGGKCITIRHSLNLNKISLAPFIFGMMVYYDNYSYAAYLYLSLAGSYGLLWVMKDYTFPDANW